MTFFVTNQLYTNFDIKKYVNSQSKSHRGNGDGVTMRNVVEISLGKLKKRQK